MVEAFAFEPASKYLLRDRDGIYGTEFVDRVAGLGTKEKLIAPRAPWQSPYVERLIGSFRRECLNHFIILNERHLKAATDRIGCSSGKIRTRARLGGLLKFYYREAA